MILYIAEKPSLGRALAQALPKPQQKGDGFVTAANGDVVSWCIGHLLEQAEPEAYDPAFKKWSKEHLPIVPTTWQLQVKPKTRKQFGVLKKLIKQADLLVNVGDPDREGQMLVDEVINYCGVSKAKLAQVQRCLINDLNPAAVAKSLANLRLNTEFIPLAASALARARADWLYGINMTRLCTLQGQQSGYRGVLSIGRVQTPLLGLVVHRDQEISAFVSKPFYEVWVDLTTEQGATFAAKWQPSQACAPHMDADGRVLSKALAHNVVGRVTGQQGRVTQVIQQKKSQTAPLPYNLSSLQIDAAKRFGFSAKQVLDLCQQLYEKHNLITYPRSDCRYLPVAHYAEASKVSSAIAKTANSLSSAVTDANLSIKSKAWNDKKISAHHAITPTAKAMDASRLTATEAKVYELIARQYLMQFYPAFEYMDQQIHSQVAGGSFVAKQKQIVALGWKALVPKTTAKAGKDDDDFAKPKLPNLTQGDKLTCATAQVLEKQTSPPKHFTDATLLAAMTGIARFVQDPALKKVLRDTDGLGTEATRAGIIELLFKRQFIARQGKDIRATSVGLQLISSLPEVMAHPDMTAQWESQLNAISHKQLKYQQFMLPMVASLTGLIGQVAGLQFAGLQGMGKASYKKRRYPKTKK